MPLEALPTALFTTFVTYRFPHQRRPLYVQPTTWEALSLYVLVRLDLAGPLFLLGALLLPVTALLEGCVPFE